MTKTVYVVHFTDQSTKFFNTLEGLCDHLEESDALNVPIFFADHGGYMWAQNGGISYDGIWEDGEPVAITHHCI